MLAYSGVFLVRGKNIRRLSETRSFSLLSSRFHPGFVWCGTQLGVHSLRRENGAWLTENRRDDPGAEIHSIAEDNDGNLRLGTLTGRAFKLDVAADGRIGNVTAFDHTQGLPDGQVLVAYGAKHVMFAAANGLLRFDEGKQSFVPDAVLGSQWAAAENNLPVFRLMEDQSGTIWFHSKSRNHKAVPKPEGGYADDSRSFLRLPTTAQVNQIFPDPSGSGTWFATNIGLIHYRESVNREPTAGFQTVIRLVTVNNRPIYNGHPKRSAKDNMALMPLPVLPYGQRNLGFSICRCLFRSGKRT